MNWDISPFFETEKFDLSALFLISFNTVSKVSRILVTLNKYMMFCVCETWFRYQDKGIFEFNYLCCDLNLPLYEIMGRNSLVSIATL